MELGLELLSAYGTAIRGYWGSIDGRSVRNDLDYIASIIRGDLKPTKEEALHNMGICSKCGSWAYLVCECPKEDNTKE